MYFYFLNQGQFFLLVTFCFPPLSYCQQNQQNFALECLLISGQESACTVPGRVKFLHCSWTRGFFGRLFRASEKTENKTPLKSITYQQRFRSNWTTCPIITHVTCHTRSASKPCNLENTLISCESKIIACAWKWPFSTVLALQLHPTEEILLSCSHLLYVIRLSPTVQFQGFCCD